MLGNKRGSISVFLVIIMSAIVLFCSLFFSVSQYNSSKRAVKAIDTLVVRNALQGYNKSLYAKYGIRAFDKKTISDRVNQLIALNYNEYLMDSFHIGIKKRKINFQASLNDNAVLKKYMVQHMKEDLVKNQIKRIEEVIENLFSNTQIKGIMDFALGADKELLGDAKKMLEDFSIDKLNEFNALDSLILDQYFLSHFSYNSIPEVEEIITGVDNNAGVIAMLTTLRFITNLGYFIMSPSFMSKATAYATALAGVTVVGIPIAKAGIIFAWCMAEAAIDVSCLLDGMTVPLIKTENMWTISETNFIEKGADFLAEKGKKILKNEVSKGKSEVEAAMDDLENRLNSVCDSVKDTYNFWIDTALEPLMEKKEDCKEALKKELTQLRFNIPIVDELIESEIAKLLEKIDDEFFTGKLDDVREKLDDKVEQILLKPIREKIAELKEQLQKQLDKGEEKVYEFIDEIIGGGNGESLKIAKGAGLMLDYEDYLRVFLLLTGENAKLNRAKKVMERNLPGFNFKQGYTRLCLDMEVEVKMLLIGKKISVVDNYAKEY